MRAAVCGTAAGLLALALYACGGAGGAPQTVTLQRSGGTPARSASSTTLASGTSSPATATQTSTLGRDGRSPSLIHLQAVLQRVAGGLGPHVGVAVEDLSTQKMLFRRGVSLAQPPASLEKLYTSAALLWLMGPNARLRTQLLGTGQLGAGGVWHGNLYLRGDGDPTFGDGGWNKIYEQGYGPTAGQLIADLRAHGIKRVNGLLYADPYRFDSAVGGPATKDGPDPGDYGGELSALVYDHGMTTAGLGPAASAVHELALAARSSGMRLVASSKRARTPGDAHLIATLSSPSLATMLTLMDVPSDDLFADLFAKQLGYQLFGQGTLSLGALAIRQAISGHYSLSPTIYDGSGLDKADRSTPAQLLALLARMYGSSIGDEVRAALPVMGKSGTVAGMGLKTHAVKNCEAKTGTLNNVTNLAGYCQVRGGDTVAFVFMVDGPSNWQSLSAFTPMVGAVAGY